MKLKFYNFFNFVTTNSFKYRLYIGLKTFFFKYLNFKYLKGFKYKYSIFKLININILLKQSLKIIYEYNYLNNYIFFVGFPVKKKNNFFKLIIKSNHHFLIYNEWVSNTIYNRIEFIENLKKKAFSSVKKKKLKILKILFKNMQIQNKPNLIVIYDHRYLHLVNKESINLNIPIVLFSNLLKINEKDLYYFVLGNFQKKFSEKFLFFLLNIVLTLPSKKKTNILKKKKNFLHKSYIKKKKNISNLTFWN